MKKCILTIVLACSVSAVFAQFGGPVKVGVDKVIMSDAVTSREYVGRIIASEQVAVVAQVAGEIKEVCFKEGDTVKRGDVLYKLDDVKYVAAAAAAEASVSQAKAGLEYAEKTFNRTKTLFERKVSTADDFDSATSAFENAKAALAAAEANLLLAKDNLKHAVITAGVSGKIGLNSFTVGNYVSLSSGPLTAIVTMDPVRMKFSMSNRDFIEIFGSEANIKNDSEITIELANGSKYPSGGKVLFIDNTANMVTDSITVYVEFSNTDSILIPGSGVTITATRKTTRKLPAVPVTAVVRDRTGAFVFLVTADNKAERRDISTGSTFGAFQYVENGLNEGDVVVTLGTHKVTPGADLIPQPSK